MKGDKPLANNYKASTEAKFESRWLETKVSSKGYVLHLTGKEAGLRWALKLYWRWVKTSALGHLVRDPPGRTKMARSIKEAPVSRVRERRGRRRGLEGVGQAPPLRWGQGLSVEGGGGTLRRGATALVEAAATSAPARLPRTRRAPGVRGGFLLGYELPGLQ